MKKFINETLQSAPVASDILTDILQKGARELLAKAIEVEVQDWIAGHADLTDENGRRMVVGNGYLLEREIVTSLEPAG